MSLSRNILWRPRGIFRSVGEWASARQQQACLKPLPAELLDVAADAARWQLAELPGGKVIGDARLVATTDDEVLGRLQILHGEAEPAAHWAVRQTRLRWPQRLQGTVAILASAASGNYYHWLFDALPRLHLLKAAGVDWKSIDWFLIGETPRRFDIETLELLGIPPQKLVRCSKRRVVVADRLLVPPMPSSVSGQSPAWVGEFLRRSFLPTVPATNRRRLFLSRRGVQKRPLLNETEVENLFREHGFETVFPERLSFREQVSVFVEAAVLAGPHGAAFANLVFAPASAPVIELFHPLHQEPCYEEIARTLGMTYHRLVGAAPAERAADRSEKLGPYSVPTDQLKTLLARHGF